MSHPRIIFFLFAFLLSAYSCTHEPIVVNNNQNSNGNTSNPINTVGKPCNADTVYFANDIFPLISSTCASTGCHDAVSRREGVVLTTYSNIKIYVSAGKATGSTLYRVITKTGNERMPPPPAAAWTTDQINMLAKWINQGALDNSCDRCDTTNFKFAANIKPIIQNNCVGCHSGANPSGKIDLSTYTGIQIIALNGKLYGSVSWSGGFSPMPKSQKLPNCQIIQIKKWINAGSQNN